MSDKALTSEEEDRVLAGEYVLGLLNTADRAAVDHRLTTDPALRALVAAWADDMVALTDDMDEVLPPDRVWTNLNADLFGEKRRGLFGRWAGFSVIGYALGGVVAAGFAWMVFVSGLLDPVVPEFRASVVSEDARIAFAADFDADTGKLYLARARGEPAPDRSFELWLIADGSDPVSLIVWPEKVAENVIKLPDALAAKVAGGVLAISDEPRGGSPTGLPTGTVLAVGQIVAL